MAPLPAGKDTYGATPCRGSREASAVRIGVPREVVDGERRVALVPAGVEKLVEGGFEVLVEAGAGGDWRPDAGYEEAGATIVESAGELYAQAEIVLKVQPPTEDEVGSLQEGAVLVCMLDPVGERERLEQLAERRVTTLSLIAMPRTGQAQSMDALSSMSSIAGYAGVLIAAREAGRYLPMMTTAAGTTKAARVMVLGVGVAGLQAIATARRLGAEVEAFDIRPEVKDQVRSLGATFLEAEPDDEEDTAPAEDGPDDAPGRVEAYVKALLGLPADFGRRRRAQEDDDGGGEDNDEEDDGDAEPDEDQQRADQELVAERIAEMDVVITTALVPGKPAPTLVTREMVERMKPGTVLLDLAVEAGGNCELSEPGETVESDGVRILGPLNLPSEMPIHSSELYSRNLTSLLSHLAQEGELRWDWEDEITAAVVLTHEGELRDAAEPSGEEPSDEEDDDA
jgi:proton-translocating NAD(P)+ transhydrogenase subunit alpha